MLPGRPCCQQVTKIPQIMWLTAAIRLNFHLADDRHTEKKKRTQALSGLFWYATTQNSLTTPWQQLTLP